MMKAKRMPLKVQAKCCQTLSSLLESGFSLGQALQFVTIQYPRQKTQLNAIGTVLAEGGALSNAFDAGGFMPVVGTQVGLSGQHGDLAGTLAELADYLTLLAESRGRVGALLAYPCTLLVLLTVLQAGIVYWVLPQLTLKPAGAMLPQIIMCCAVLIAVLVVVITVKGMTAESRYHLLRHIPIVGGMLQKYYQYEFVLGAASFLGVGRDLGSYCDYLGATGSGPLATLGDQVGEQVMRGVGLPVALDNVLVPKGFVELVEMGQEPQLFARSVGAYARGLFTDLQAQMGRILAFVQPLMFIVLGVQIVVMYARLLLPLYSVIGGY
jgi:competence protein ComGB